MDNELFDDEFNMMYNEKKPATSFNAQTFMQPIKNIDLHTPVMLDAGATIAEVVSLMQIKQFGCLLITREEKLAGILTERDIVSKALDADRELVDIRAEEIMTPNPESFLAEDSIAFIMNAMAVGGYRHVPIVNESGQPTGIVSVKDIVTFICEQFPEEVLNLPPKPIRKTEHLDGG